MLKSGWRPLIGWVTALAMFVHFIFLRIVFLFHSVPDYPHLTSGELISLGTLALGIGAYRTYEKEKELTE